MEEIDYLKKKYNAKVLAHYYVKDEVKKVADYIGDSFYLAKKAKELDCDVIVMAGVYFMGESVKILNPDKKVLLPDLNADCPMAHMISIEEIEKIRNDYNDLAVVTYINSTAEIKAHSDVCVTSSNAVNIINKLSKKNIYFIPDKNLGEFIKNKLPEKNIILNNGYCPVHENINLKDIINKNIPILAHPECRNEVLKKADYVGSTSGIIENANKYNEMTILTEEGILSNLKNKYPNKKFYTLKNKTECKDMKLITLDKILEVLKNKSNEVILDENIRKKALIPLERMLTLGA